MQNNLNKQQIKVLAHPFADIGKTLYNEEDSVYTLYVGEFGNAIEEDKFYQSVLANFDNVEFVDKWDAYNADLSDYPLLVEIPMSKEQAMLAKLAV